MARFFHDFHSPRIRVEQGVGVVEVNEVNLVPVLRGQDGKLGQTLHNKRVRNLGHVPMSTQLFCIKKSPV